MKQETVVYLKNVPNTSSSLTSSNENTSCELKSSEWNIVGCVCQLPLWHLGVGGRRLGPLPHRSESDRNNQR